MSFKQALLVILGGITLVVMTASAHADTVCDDYGKCWEQRYPAYGESRRYAPRFPHHHWHYWNPYGATHPERHHHHDD